MKKLMIAAVAVAFGVSAYAEAQDWFNGGIAENWPTAASMTGGTWTQQEGATFAGGALNIAATNAVTFTAASAKELGVNTDSVTITSTIEFSPFMELPAVPEGAKGGVIIYKDGETLKYYVLAAEGAGNVWTEDQAFQGTVSTDSVEVTITLTKEGDDYFISYTYDGESGYSGYFAPGDSVVSAACYAGDGTVTALAGTYEGEAPAVEPVAPGDPIEIPAGATVEDFIATVNDNKATLLKAPEDVVTGEDLTAYQSLFTAALDGTQVKFVLNEDGTNAVVDATAAIEPTTLEVALSTETDTLTVEDPLPGFYYSFKQGATVDGLDFNDEGDKNNLAGQDDIEFTLVKPDGAGFYQTIITPTQIQ